MLGRKATDIITGLEGIITAMAEFQHSPTRYELTPTKLKGGKAGGEVMKSIWIDEPRIKAGKAFITPSEAASTVTLGQEAEDTITGFKGVVTGRYTFVNGCIRIEITPKTLKDGSLVDPQVFDEPRLKGHESAGGQHGTRPNPTAYSKV